MKTLIKNNPVPWGLKVTWWKSRVRMRSRAVKWREHELGRASLSMLAPPVRTPHLTLASPSCPTTQASKQETRAHFTREGRGGGKRRLRGTKRQGRTAQNSTSEAPTGTNQPGTRWDERRGSPRLINFRIPKACKFFWTRTLAFQSIHPQPLIQNTWSRMCLAIVTFSH